MQPLLIDNHLLAVAKAAGEPVQEDASGDQSLQQRWQAWLKREFHKPGNVFLGIVHRLDRPVSGVLLFARTSKAAGRLADAWRRGVVRKSYWGVGELAPGAELPGEQGELEQWLLKDRERNQVRPVAPGTPGAKLATTRWRLLGRRNRRLALELEPVTGRSHQLRVACAGLGAPLLGDRKYGGAGSLAAGRAVALHARRLEFPHPVREERIALQAPLPGHFPAGLFPD